MLVPKETIFPFATKTSELRCPHLFVASAGANLEDALDTDIVPEDLEVLKTDEDEETAGPETVEIINEQGETPAIETIQDDTVPEGAKNHDDGRPNLIDTPDSWKITGQYLVRHHINQRIKMFSPLDGCDTPPIPLEQLDIYRRTNTDGDANFIR